MLRIVDFSVLYFLFGVLSLVGFERSLASGEFINEDSNAPDVNSVIIRFVIDYFRTQVV
jgi:hypothetical protein